MPSRRNFIIGGVIKKGTLQPDNRKGIHLFQGKMQLAPAFNRYLNQKGKKNMKSVRLFLQLDRRQPMKRLKALVKLSGVSYLYL